MINFTFGLFVGIFVGIFGTFVSGILMWVVVEDSPNIIEAVKDQLNEK